MDSFSELNSNYTFDEISDLDSQRESLKTSFIKIRKAQKELKSYENLLNNKEKSLVSKSEEIEQSMQTVVQERRQLEKEKILFEIEKQSFSQEKQNFSAFQEKFKGKLEKFKVKKYELKEKIKKSEEIIKKTRDEFENIEKNKGSLKHELENIRAEYAKIDAENKVLNNNIRTLAAKKAEIEKLEEEVEKMKDSNKKEKLKLQNERESIQKIKRMLEEERNRLKVEITEAENARKHYEDCLKVQEDQSNSPIFVPSNICHLFDALERQIKVFNEEISIKESKLQQKEENLFKTSKNLSELSRKLSQTEHFMSGCKVELLSLKSKIIPELESMFVSGRTLLAELNEKIKELNVLNEKLNHDVNAIYDIKMITLNHQEKIDNHFKALEKKENELKDFAISLEERQSNMSALSENRMDVTISELEQNLILLKQKQDEVDREAVENCKNAEYLKICIQEIEETKGKLIQEKLRFKEKNNLIEIKQKQLTERFKELEIFHSSLRKKEAELQSIQKQICNLEYLNKNVCK